MWIVVLKLYSVVLQLFLNSDTVFFIYWLNNTPKASVFVVIPWRRKFTSQSMLSAATAGQQVHLPWSCWRVSVVPSRHTSAGWMLYFLPLHTVPPRNKTHQSVSMHASSWGQGALLGFKSGMYVCLYHKLPCQRSRNSASYCRFGQNIWRWLSVSLLHTLHCVISSCHWAGCHQHGAHSLCAT